MASFRRARDTFYAIYYLIHLPISILFDSQLIFPMSWFSPTLLHQSDLYIRNFKDPLVGNAPAWFLASIYIEIFLMVPFFVVGFFGALKGIEETSVMDSRSASVNGILRLSSNASRMRIPSIIYGTTVITQCLPMITYVLVDEFEGSRIKPATDSERWLIAGIYGSFFLVGATILLDNLFFRTAPKDDKNFKSRLNEILANRKRQ
ncbi:hypothetical protein RvY_14435 [Ramazzottius varieornatus]|uniref:Sigma intracellular receptor 2 n=1 Tax=Ramazzottius varieornatus TaxID=947166 RepID=A0A1D1VRA8_RAMVA|nr:hypothetical protein RvY_14435 [Ramazzottius varieornatus]